MVILNATSLFIKAKCYEAHQNAENVENFTQKTGLKRAIKIDYLEKNDRQTGCKPNDLWLRKLVFYQ